MKVDITRHNLIRTILYFLILFVIFRIRESLYVVTQDTDLLEMPLAKLIELPLSFGVITTGLTFLMAFINSFFITSIVSKNLIFLERTYMPSLIYLLISLGYFSSNESYIMLIVAFLLICALHNMIASFKRNDTSRHFLNTSVAIGTASLIYAPAAIFSLLLPIGLIAFRKNFGNWIVSLLGVTIPTFLCSYVYWGMGYDFLYIPELMWNIISSPAKNTISIPQQINIIDIVLVLVLLAIIVFSIATFVKRSKTMRKRSYKAYLTFIWAGIVSLAMLVLPCRSLSVMPILAVPLSIIIPTYFNRREGFLPNLLYMLIIISIIVYNLMPLLGIPQINIPL